MRISVTSNVTEVLGWTARLHPQFRYAVARTLTDVMSEVKRGLPAEVERSFEGGAVDYTKRGFYIEPARKESLVSAVAVKDDQAKYLRYQIEGGRRSPTHVALRLPSVVQLTAQGNLPSGLIRQLIARAKAGKRALKRQAKRFGVSQAVDLFYGDPGDGRPPGIYKRIVRSSSQHQLVPIVVFPKRDAVYKERRFDFYGFADRTVRKSFDAALERNWREALATAR